MTTGTKTSCAIRIPGLISNSLSGPVPAGNIDLTLVVTVNQTHQVTQHQTVFVTQPGPRQDDRCHTRIGYVHGEAGRYQLGFARMNNGSAFNTRAQVHSR